MSISLEHVTTISMISISLHTNGFKITQNVAGVDNRLGRYLPHTTRL